MPGPVIAGSPIFADTLRRMGERGDIIRTLQRAYAAKGQAPAIADQVIYDSEVSDARSLVGRSEEHESELQLLMSISNAVFSLLKRAQSIKVHIISHYITYCCDYHYSLT